METPTLRNHHDPTHAAATHDNSLHVKTPHDNSLHVKTSHDESHDESTYPTPHQTQPSKVAPSTSLIEEMVAAGMHRDTAQEIIDLEWGSVHPDNRPPIGTDFAQYVREKIHLTKMREQANPGGFLKQAIKENWDNPELQKERDREKRLLARGNRKSGLCRKPNSSRLSRRNGKESR